MRKKNEQPDMDFLVDSMTAQNNGRRGRPAGEEKKSYLFHLRTCIAEKVRVISRIENIPMSKMVDDFLERYVNAYESEHGEVILHDTESHKNTLSKILRPGK